MAVEHVYGMHPVLEVLQAGRRRVERILLASRRPRIEIQRLIDLAAQCEVPLDYVESAQLRRLVGHDQHQGVVALVAPLGYDDLADALAVLEQQGGPHTLLLLDGMTDVGNFATLVRSAAAFGVKVIFLPRHQSVGLTPTVAKRSAGAIERIAVVQVGNVVRALEQLKALGFWVYGADARATTRVAQVRWPERVVLIVGAEGRGMRRLVRAHCDHLVRIPMRAGFDSINAAVAGSILLAAIWAQHEMTEQTPEA
jgi:23S rRNA (guanosine2251-2'-O)-methyltransferase